ncbi:branched-chain amino acid ABC transporter substrate-binding protein [Trinickia acidisoli]|uniref:branched-chain amino acid ABC transporter substrate-binding protein n=1 Tax=Trinickia acidisoli TaxID=2767482 RepID=UPI001A9064EF|nr:branched-chain amino acid ABC transporter substrate-binding protein [Trinickia acidisoli]
MNRLLNIFCIVTFAMFAMTAAKAGEIKIAVAGPLTGQQANYGKDDERGVQLAVADINEKKFKIDGNAAIFMLESQDDQGDPKTGVAVAQKFADEGVKAVLGHYSSGVSIPASAIYNAAHIPEVTASATNPALTKQGFAYVFRLTANDELMGARVAEFAVKELHLKRIAVVDDRSAYGAGVADIFVSTIKKLGATVATREYTNDQATDFIAILTKIKATHPDGILFGGYYAQAAAIGRQSRQIGLSVPILGGDGICSVELPKLSAGALDGRAYCAQSGTPLKSLSGGNEFASRYEKTFGAAPDAYAPAYYAATTIIAEAMHRANSSNPQRYLLELRNGTFETLIGTVKFDKNGDWLNAPVTMYKVEGNELNALK